MSLNLNFHISDFHNLKIVSNVFFFIFEDGLIFYIQWCIYMCMCICEMDTSNRGFSHYKLAWFILVHLTVYQLLMGHLKPKVNVWLYEWRFIFWASYSSLFFVKSFVDNDHLFAHTFMLSLIPILYKQFAQLYGFKHSFSIIITSK